MPNKATPYQPHQLSFHPGSVNRTPALRINIKTKFAFSVLADCSCWSSASTSVMQSKSSNRFTSVPIRWMSEASD